jgi:hypothetical protein
LIGSKGGTEPFFILPVHKLPQVTSGVLEFVDFDGVAIHGLPQIPPLAKRVDTLRYSGISIVLGLTVSETCRKLLEFVGTVFATSERIFVAQ